MNHIVTTQDEQYTQKHLKRKAQLVFRSCKNQQYIEDNLRKHNELALEVSTFHHILIIKLPNPAH
jgi:hypothetical protein